MVDTQQSMGKERGREGGREAAHCRGEYRFRQVKCEQLGRPQLEMQDGGSETA